MDKHFSIVRSIKNKRTITSGVSRQYLSDIGNGKVIPNTSIIEAIHKVF